MNKIEIPSYDPKTGKTEMLTVDLTRSIKEQNPESNTNLKETKRNP